MLRVRSVPLQAARLHAPCACVCVCRKTLNIDMFVCYAVLLFGFRNNVPGFGVCERRAHMKKQKQPTTYKSHS